MEQDLLRTLGDYGMGVITIIVLAYLLIQQSSLIKGFQQSVDRNTESTDKLKDGIDSLKESVRGCSYNKK